LWAKELFLSKPSFLLLFVLIFEVIKNSAVDLEQSGTKEDPLDIFFTNVKLSRGLVFPHGKQLDPVAVSKALVKCHCWVWVNGKKEEEMRW